MNGFQVGDPNLSVWTKIVMDQQTMWKLTKA